MTNSNASRNQAGRQQVCEAGRAGWGLWPVRGHLFSLKGVATSPQPEIVAMGELNPDAAKVFPVLNRNLKNRFAHETSPF